MFEDEEPFDIRQREHTRISELEDRKIVMEIVKDRMDILTSEDELKIVSLYGGFSGSRVFRLEKCVASFGLVGRTDCELPNCVIKVNTKYGFDREALNYSRIPKDLRSILCPIDLDDLRNTRGSGIYYLLSKDLLEYNTLFNMVCNAKPKENITPVVSAVFSSLASFYQKHTHNNDFGIMPSLYFGKIQDTLRRMSEKKSLPPQLIKDVGKSIRIILEKQRDLEPSFATVCHGDLNARNTMIRKTDLDIKLIDFDHLSPYGDYIYDLGELLCHLTEILPIEETFEVELPDISSEKKEVSTFLRPLMTNEIEKIAKKMADSSNWKKRLLLSEARFLLTCAANIDGRKQAVLCGKRALSKCGEILK